MKIVKILLVITTSIILIGLIGLRIRKVSNDESTAQFFDKEGARRRDFLAAEYLPVKKEVEIQDTILFKPGSIWIHDEIKLKHKLYIFSEYFEKSPSNGKNLIYSSNDNTNNHELILCSNRYDSTLNEMIFSKEQNRNKSYFLDDDVVTNKGNMANIKEYEDLETLMFYVKRKHIDFGADIMMVPEYDMFQVKLDKHPIDSILFYKVK